MALLGLSPSERLANECDMNYMINVDLMMTHGTATIADAS